MIRDDFDRRATTRINGIKRKMVEHISSHPGCSKAYVISKMEKESKLFRATRMTTRNYLVALQREEVISEKKFRNGLASELYVNAENILLILQNAIERVETQFRILSQELVAAINSNKSKRMDVEDEVSDILIGLTEEYSALVKILVHDYVLIWSRQITNKHVKSKLHELILSGLANIESAIVHEFERVKGIENIDHVWDISTRKLWYQYPKDQREPKEDLLSICERVGLFDEWQVLNYELVGFPEKH